MSAVASAPASPTPNPNARRNAIRAVAGFYVFGLIVFGVIYGIKGHKNVSVTRALNPFSPVDEFKLDTWFKVGPIDFNKGVLYVVVAAVITLGFLLYLSRHMSRRPGRWQVALEWMYNLTRGMSQDNMDEKMAKKWFPVIFTLFVFILVSNVIGYIPLPVDSAEKFNLFGAHIPSFQIYAATTNLSVPLVLALIVFISYTTEGIRHSGPIGYLKGLMPPGVSGGMRYFIFPLEVTSNFLRLISLTIRLWANLMAGHLLIAFMAGDLSVLLGLQFLGWFTLPLGIAIFLFECVLIAGLQAFIFAILTAIYLGGAVSGH
ncbi:MAG TPA: F0F1 ATP synthase subunit A [Solirubrobacteraceae bacterium]|jgi:F-type H+-transporting ATPase subunit a|nr:F0F1 ATP synthase subunit A [Solirubrobacteraceae bacterium]